MSLEGSRKGLLAADESVQALAQNLNGRGTGGGRKKKEVKGSEIYGSDQEEHEAGEFSDSDKAWMQSLSGSRLDLMVGVKKLAMRRLETAGSDAYAGVLGPRALRVMEIVLDEYIKDQLRKVDKELRKVGITAEETDKQVGKGEKELISKEGKTGEEIDKQGQTGSGRSSEGKETDCEESVKVVEEMWHLGDNEKSADDPERKRSPDSEKAPHQAKRKRSDDLCTEQSQPELRAKTRTVVVTLQVRGRNVTQTKKG